MQVHKKGKRGRKFNETCDIKCNDGTLWIKMCERKRELFVCYHDNEIFNIVVVLQRERENVAAENTIFTKRKMKI